MSLRYQIIDGVFITVQGDKVREFRDWRLQNNIVPINPAIKSCDWLWAWLIQNKVWPSTSPGGEPMGESPIAGAPIGGSALPPTSDVGLYNSADAVLVQQWLDANGFTQANMAVAHPVDAQFSTLEKGLIVSSLQLARVMAMQNGHDEQWQLYHDLAEKVSRL